MDTSLSWASINWLELLHKLLFTEGVTLQKQMHNFLYSCSSYSSPVRYTSLLFLDFSSEDFSISSILELVGREVTNKYDYDVIDKVIPI